MTNRKIKASLLQIYQKLFKEFGPQHWWPAETKFEVIVGAILTQNTSWGNVEKAIGFLKSHRLLSACALRDIPIAQLAGLIKPAGYFNVKARRLKNFIQFFFDEYQGNMQAMGKEDRDSLRQKLLGVSGIGPETADSILLYALEKPVFVVDAYTKRFLYRHNFIHHEANYQEIQKLFTTHLNRDVLFFGEYHALIVALGKNYCKPTPLCESCPLNRIHYSLSFKCGLCHRALLDKQERMVDKVGLQKAANMIDPSIRTTDMSVGPYLICLDCHRQRHSQR